MRQTLKKIRGGKTDSACEGMTAKSELINGDSQTPKSYGRK